MAAGVRDRGVLFIWVYHEVEDTSVKRPEPFENVQ
jgi:hypothetical protein